jgi:GNAT superfamily N-acetyltransferase
MTEPTLKIEREWDRGTRVDLMLGEKSISRLWVIRFEIRIGAATVKMDGIGGVGTDEAFRNRGYSRRVLEATLEHMRAGDAALSMLYGIRDFYPKFGYATAGPEHFLKLRRLDAPAPMPPGWRARPFQPPDQPALHRLYEQQTAGSVGAAVRDSHGGPWFHGEHSTPLTAEQCRVVEDSSGNVRAYAWRATWHWAQQMADRHYPQQFVVGEVMADGPVAADAILSVCRTWAVEEAERSSRTLDAVLIAQPPEGPVAAAAMLQSADLIQYYSYCGGSMARVLDSGRLLTALAPELRRRWLAAPTDFRGCLTIHTEVGSATLDLGPDGVTVLSPSPLRGGGQGERLTVQLPQTALARLALGAFHPGDLLARLETPPTAEAARLLATLFPQRHPHMHLPDRY